MALLVLAVLLLGLPAMAAGAENSTDPAVQPVGRATLKLVRISPLTVVGQGFRAGERVLISADGRRKTLAVGARGGFRVSFPGANTCNGFVVFAVGSEGSRASLSFAQFSNVHCLESLATGAGATQSAGKPILRLVGYEPLTVRGDAFRPGERVRLVALGSLKRLSRTTTASASGVLKASFTLGADRCSPLVVAAVGSMGSRATARVLHRPCNPPRVPPPRQ